MRRVLCWFLVLASLGTGATAAADVQTGMDAYDIGDYETALAECQPAAESGDAIAQFCIGRMYANGFGVAMDDALALKWYGLAADQGHAEALYNLGVMHSNGWGVPMDDSAAAAFFAKAADLGSPLAQMSLANLCRNGRGVELDLAEAYKWYTIAAELGNMNASFKLDELVIDITEEERQRATASAEEWLAKNNGSRVDSDIPD